MPAARITGSASSSAPRAPAQADLVIANHALVMVNAARGRDGRARRGSCSTRATTCSTPPTARSPPPHRAGGDRAKRWIIGPEGGSRGRRRGLAARLADVASYDEEGGRAIGAAGEAAEALPADGWLQRLAEGMPFGPIETLLAAVRGTVYARDESGAGSGLRHRDRGRPTRRPLCRARQQAAQQALGSAPRR